MKLLLTCLVAVLASVSAFLWVKSARASVLAASQTGGFGAMMGGDLIAKGADGERINMHATLVEQSLWNRYAAYSAALCALVQAIVTTFYPS